MLTSGAKTIEEEQLAVQLGEEFTQCGETVCTYPIFLEPTVNRAAAERIIIQAQLLRTALRILGSTVCGRGLGRCGCGGMGRKDFAMLNEIGPEADQLLPTFQKKREYLI